MAETDAHHIGELSLKLQRLRINPQVVSSDLEAVETNVAEMMSIREKLNTADARRILGHITVSQTSTVEVLKGALKFVEGVTTVDLPPSMRTKILCGPTETFVDELKAHQTAAEEALNAITPHKQAAVELWAAKRSRMDRIR